jgi:hypothetical protein
MRGYQCEKWTAESDGMSVHSGNNTNNHRLISVFSMAVTLVRPGYVLFRYKVDAEERYDFLIFLMDSEMTAFGYQSTVLEWREANISLSAGPHKLEWEYIKDFGGSRGLDKAQIQVVEVVGTDFADVRCEPCSTDFAPGCNLCPADHYQLTAFNTTCLPCPTGTYSNAGAVGVAQCLTRPACTRDDMYPQYGECRTDGKRRMQWTWVLPHICDQNLPNSEQLPSAEASDVACAPCAPGSMRDPVDATCKPCALGTYSPDGSACLPCGSGKYAPRSSHFTSFVGLPANFTTDCSASSTFSGSCATGMTWQGLGDYLATGESIVSRSDVTLTMVAQMDPQALPRGQPSGADAFVSFTYSLTHTIEGVELLFYVNNVTAFSASRAANRTRVTVPLPRSEDGSTAYTLRWIYRRATDSTGDDRAMLHDIAVSGTATGGASECLACPPGRYSPASSGARGVSVCPRCSPGTYSKDGSVDKCLACTAGAYANLEGSSACTTCPKGLWSTPGQALCGLDGVVSLTNRTSNRPSQWHLYGLTPPGGPTNLFGPASVSDNSYMIFGVLYQGKPPVYLGLPDTADPGYAFLVVNLNSGLVDGSYGDRSSSISTSSSSSSMCNGNFPPPTTLVMNAGRVVNAVRPVSGAVDGGVEIEYGGGDECDLDGVPSSISGLAPVRASVTLSILCGDSMDQIDYLGSIDTARTTNCSAVFRFVDPRGCPVCTAEDFSHLVVCNNSTGLTSTVVTRRGKCFDANKVEDAVRRSLADVEGDKCLDYETYARERKASRSRLVALIFLVIGLLGVAGFGGYYLVRLTRSKRAVDRELSRFRATYGENLLDVSADPLDPERTPAKRTRATPSTGKKSNIDDGDEDIIGLEFPQDDDSDFDDKQRLTSPQRNKK